MMPNRPSSTRWLPLATVTVLCLSGCSKRPPNAPTQDFARRHQCPVTTVKSTEEASNRLRVTGCGESEIYVRSCENKPVAFPASEAHQPILEAEAKNSPPLPLSEQGCAWTRQQAMPAPSASGAQPPKWLSTP